MRQLLLLLFALTCKLANAQFTNEFITYSTTNTPVFSGNNFKAVGIGKGNRIWAGTQYQGLYWFDTARKAWTKSSQLTNVFINHIVTDRDGGIWIAQSGTSGTSGGGSNIAGGVNYFPDTTDAGMQYYSNANFLSSRNVRCLYLDNSNWLSGDIRRIWAAQATFITSGNTTAGGVSKWQTVSTGNFQKNFLGLQVFPNTNAVSAGTPSCYTACGDREEVWVGAETNYTSATGSTTQILRYDPLTGQFLGGYDQNGAFDNTRLYYNNQPRNYTDNSMAGILPAGFRTTAMFIDGEGRRWVGLRNGGVVVKIGNNWYNVNMPTIFPSGTTINFNAITSDEFGYIYFGTSNGVVVFDNGGDVTDTTFYKRYTTTEGLPSNNITGVCYDKAGGRMVLTSDAGVTFWKYNYRLKVDMIWDYSFPDRFNQPIGVAADGVSRIYLRVRKRSDTMPDIKTLNVSFKNYNAALANTRGSIKKANIIDRYSEEANTGTFNDITFTDADYRPGLPGDKWLWYVAPVDFCNDTSSRFANLSRRFDTLVMIATYVNNTKDTQEYKISIVRPPTLFVHGLASSPAAWSGLSHLYFGKWQTFLNSPLFVYKRAPAMDPVAVFQKNGAQLLGGDIRSVILNLDRYNTLQGNIELMRNRNRYASNQVDYVCHSMGGIMIRTAIGLYPKKFFATEGDPYIYKTYGKGFTHKIITLNTPHNGAPVADAVDELIPKAQGILRTGLNTAYELQTGLLSGFIKPVGTGNFFNGDFKATDAVNNLQVTRARGGVAMLRTPGKNHMICTNLNWVKYSQYLGSTDYYLHTIFKLLMQIQYAQTYDLTVYTLSEGEQKRASLRVMMAQETEKAYATFLDSMAKRRNFDNYLAYSDGIVPMKSQTAQQDEVTALHITKFLGDDTTQIILPVLGNIGSVIGFNGNHSAVTSRKDAGQRVFQLLNTRVSSVVFADEIPANNDPETPYNLRPANTAGRPLAAPVIQTFYDSTKIKIDAPARNSTAFADSLITVKFRIKDTARLAYLTVHFQDADSIRVNKLLTQQSISFYADPSFSYNGLITAVAVYENTDRTGLNYYVDTISVTPTNAAPLQGFRVLDEVAEVRAGQPYYPVYEAQYNNKWVRILNSDPFLQAVVDSPLLVSFDTASKSFNALAEGACIANFTYKGFTDSMVLRTYMPYNYNCINYSVAGGNFSNPAVWSKSVVPDICDSVVISSGHNIIVDTGIIIHALRVNSGGTLTFNQANDTLQIGEIDEHFANSDIFGTLAVSNGGLKINGHIKFNPGSTFNMTGGKIAIDGNAGTKEMSIADGISLFEAAAGMSAFNFSGGTLQLNNPPYGAASQALNCVYDFGNNSILMLGTNTSSIASKNADGFGGLSFPNKIGKLVVNAGTRSGNRQFINKKALTIKGNAEVRTGSGIVVQAPITVNQ